MNDQRRRRKLIWALVAGGGLLVAVFAFSTLAPQPGPQATEPVIRTVADSSLAANSNPVAAAPMPSPADNGIASATGAGFSLGGGELISLAWRLGLVVIVIAGSIVGLRWWTRRSSGPRSTTGYLRVVDTLAIGTGRSIHLVSIGERIIAVGATTQQLSFLNELSAEEAEEIRATTAHASEQPFGAFAAELFHTMRSRTSNTSGSDDRLTVQEAQL